MNITFASRAVQWSSRILAIAFIIFISMFALDVFSEENWPVALLIHLIPTYVLVVFLIVAWKNDMIGGLLFILGGIIFMGVSRFEGYVIFIPAIVIGILFICAGWLKKASARRNRITG